MLDRLGDWLIIGSIVIYILATLAYGMGNRGWVSIYWAGCALINLAVLMITKTR